MFQARQLGPRSLLWRWAGDHRLGFTGPSAGILQLMHPAIGAGVVDHSNFFSDPWDRILRSMPAILGVVYDGDAEATGRQVRGFHSNISGVDLQGREYHALRPATFWWAHATFQHAVEQVADRFDRHHLTPPERQELYLDGVEWYRRYGMSMRPVPVDRAAFGEVWHGVCREVLELTPAAERAIDIALHGRGGEMPALPNWTWSFQRYAIGPAARLIAIGGLPRIVRDRFGIPWRIDEEMELRALELAVREGWRFVPPAMRYHPRAARGFAAARKKRVLAAVV